jgi:5'-3' exonuclease
MGIPGLFQMLKTHEQKVYIPTHIRGKTVAIDIFTYLHKSKGSKEYILNELQPFIQNAKHIIAVFDGSPSKERTESLASQSQIREIHLKQMKEIQETLKNPLLNLSKQDRAHLEKYIRSLENEAWSPSPLYMWEVCNLLKEKGIECLVLEKGMEADTYLSDLSVDIVVSNDSDLLANGVKSLLRPSGQYYEEEAVLSGLEFSKEEWKTFIKLCKHMKRPDPEFVFTVMKLYDGDDEYIYEKYGDIFV